MKFKPLIQPIAIHILKLCTSPARLYSSTINPIINNVIAETPIHNIEINQSENSLISSFFCVETINITRIDAAKIHLKPASKIRIPPSISPFQKHYISTLTYLTKLKTHAF